MAKHTCGGPVFGKLAPKGECVRCDELREGSPARAGFFSARNTKLERGATAHSCETSKCGPVCTFGDW